ncbi:GntR family transcriptional regulator [Roseibium algae]|uniref:GntR family transcriptional regulator n=1 Tax=Roseibium algae TaxID=3123038 RepID=A0ABU8TH49_9HYPH
MAKSDRSIGRFFEDGYQQQLDHGRAAGEQIFDALKRAILSMDIAPGSLIPEAEVGRRFSASRTPVREALMQLRGAGLVVTSSGSGNFATKLSELRIREARFIREVIEVGIVERLCETGIEASAQKDLQDILDSQKRCIERNLENDEFASLDDRFHLTLALATGFPRMADILEREKMVLDRLRVISLVDAGHKQALYEEHLGIYEALIAQNIEQARSFMKTHLTSVLNTLSKLAERHQEFFE